MGDPTKVMLSWSGGKDSALALHALRADPRYEVAGLLTTLATEYGRVSHHGVRAELMERQAEAVGLPLHAVWLPPAHDGDGVAMADYEALMADAMARCRAEGIHHVAFGDIYLADLRAYREEKLAGVGMAGVFPLWGRDTAALLTEFIALGFQAHAVCVDGRRLDGSFAGRSLDAAWARDLPPDVDPCGEQGEYHSFVTDGPVFTRPVPVTVGAVVQRDVRWFAELLPAGPVHGETAETGPATAAGSPPWSVGAP